ncbi:hypothetical protein ACHAP5_011863 [Fusarium lateritium]
MDLPKVEMKFHPGPANQPPPREPNVRREIDANSWMIGDVIISRHASEPSGPSWGDGKGAFFTVSEAPTPKPPTRAISDDCPIKDYYLWEPEACGVWQVGLALLDISLNKGTPQHVTLEALAKRSLSFQIPKVYYHGTFGDLYYIVHSTLPGKTICEAWPETTDDALKKRWLERIVDSCVELSAWKSESVTGITGDILHDWWLTKHDDYPASSTPDAVLQICNEIGMDCSNLVFQHNLLTPLSYTVNEAGDLLGIYHWEDAGFLPKDWIATKPSFNSSLDAWQKQKTTWLCDDVDKYDKDLLNELKGRGFRNFFHEHGKWRSQMLKERYPDVYGQP